MAMDAKAGFTGLVTATSEATGTPTGLRVADNVVLRKEGALMPRPVYASSALARQYATAIPYKGSLFFFDSANAFYPPGAGTFTSNYGATNPAVRADVWSAKEARGNLYVAAQRGVFKISTVADTGYVLAGTTALSIVSINSGVGTTLSAGQRVSYRIVNKLTDPNGLVLRSRPSGAVTFDASGNCAPILNFTVAAYWGSTKYGDVEIYRTRIYPNTVTPDEEYQLVGVFTHPGPPYYSSYQWTDRTSDAARTTTLYTSPSRGGIENANDRPPGCACLERYRGSLFFGNTLAPKRFIISYPVNRTVTGSATGIGLRTATANWTNGSATLTSVSNTTGLQVGMVAYSTPTSAYYSGGSPTITITAIAGSTVTLNQAANASATGGTINFLDSIQLSPGATFSSPSGFIPWNIVGVPMTGGLWGTSPEQYLRSGPVNVYQQTPPVAGYDQTLVIEAQSRGPSSTLAIRATHGDEYSPPLALATDATGTLGTYDEIPNGLAWSEPDEPEHVPPKNFARVGDAGKAILALVATKDRLLICKEDGLFMLTGDTAKNFAIYPLDTTCLCILPGSVRRLKNTVFMLTNLGLVAIDDTGSVQVISRPIQLEVASIVNAIRAAQKASGLYNMPGLFGVTGAGDDAQGEYHLALGSSTPSFGGQVLVYSLPRDGFTTFTFTTTPVALATDGEGNPLVLTASTLLTPTTTLGTIAARVSPRAFADPALLGKFWTHIVAGFSQLTGTTNVQAKFTSSESMVAGASITETFDLPVDAGTSLLQFPLGSLIRHPVPTAVRRAYMLFVELLINVSTGTFTLETIAAESRENASNKEPTHGSGSA